MSDTLHETFAAGVSDLVTEYRLTAAKEEQKNSANESLEQKQWRQDFAAKIRPKGTKRVEYEASIDPDYVPPQTTNSASYSSEHSSSVKSKLVEDEPVQQSGDPDQRHCKRLRGCPPAPESKSGLSTSSQGSLSHTSEVGECKSAVKSDGCWGVGSQPFVVFEVANTELEQHLTAKLLKWINECHCNLAVGFYLHHTDPDRTTLGKHSFVRIWRKKVDTIHKTTVVCHVLHQFSSLRTLTIKL